MALHISREREWTKTFREAIKNSDHWEEFNRIKNDYWARGISAGLKSDTAERQAFKSAAAVFPDVLNMEEFEAKRAARLAAENAQRKLRGFHTTIDESNDESHKRVKKHEIGNIIIADNNCSAITVKGISDVLADTKWVYENAARLFQRNLATGLVEIDRKILKKAPSNGAIGMAYYALDDYKAFYEKFVTRILPKNDPVPTEPTEEELQADLDPTLHELKKYMERL